MVNSIKIRVNQGPPLNLLIGAVIISTPQDIALIDAVKGVNMFKKVNVPVSTTIQGLFFSTA